MHVYINIQENNREKLKVEALISCCALAGKYQRIVTERDRETYRQRGRWRERERKGIDEWMEKQQKESEMEGSQNNCASFISTCLIDYFNIICYRCRRCRSYYPQHLYLHTGRQFRRRRRGRPRRESGGSRPGPPATAPAPPSVNVAAAGPARAPPNVSVGGRAREKVNACARGCEQDSKRATARPCACARDCERVFAFPRRSDSVRRSDSARVRNSASMCLRVPLPLRLSARTHERTDPH